MKAEDLARRDPEEILNQPPPLTNYNLWTADLPLREAVEREGGGFVAARAEEYGALLGREETWQLGVLANAHPPQLRTFDRSGHRIDEVEFHPAWHELMRLAVTWNGHDLPWSHPRPGAHVARLALNYMRTQIEEGHGCPITMTFASIPSLRLQEDLAELWEPRILTTRYDPRSLPAEEKESVLVGMAMTERQGGSDVRANTTRAVPIGEAGPGRPYSLTGHKWFCSAPMCDIFLVLAQVEHHGLSCFLLPRWTPERERNRFHIQRLKDKLGNRSNASSEVTLERAWAQMLGEPGRGVATIIEMVRHTRLDCVLGSSASMRFLTATALHHCAHRHAFGARLIEQPLMKNVLADLCLETEAAVALAMRLGRAFDESAGDERAGRFARVATAVAKYWVCKRNYVVAGEALECLGGNGFVEDWPMARRYRDAPLNSIWEGSGNVQVLDVLRALSGDPESFSALAEELDTARGKNDHFDAFVDALVGDFGSQDQRELRSRDLVERMALALQAAILINADRPAVSDPFCAARLGGRWGHAFGTLPAETDLDAILERGRIGA